MGNGRPEGFCPLLDPVDVDRLGLGRKLIGQSEHMPAVADAGRCGPVQPATGSVVRPRPDVRPRPTRPNGKSIPAGIPSRQNTLLGGIIADVIHPEVHAEVSVVGQTGAAVGIGCGAVKDEIAVVGVGIGGVADESGVIPAVAQVIPGSAVGAKVGGVLIQKKSRPHAVEHIGILESLPRHIGAVDCRLYGVVSDGDRDDVAGGNGHPTQGEDHGLIVVDGVGCS